MTTVVHKVNDYGMRLFQNGSKVFEGDFCHVTAFYGGGSKLKIFIGILPFYNIDYLTKIVYLQSI